MFKGRAHDFNVDMHVWCVHMHVVMSCAVVCVVCAFVVRCMWVHMALSCVCISSAQ